MSQLELANYHTLIKRVDQLCQSICSSFADHVNCHPGCSSCCRHLTIFPVEAANLLQGLLNLEAGLPTMNSEVGDNLCPLLKDDHCLAYPVRPIICRTHGLPLLAELDGEKRVDFCPENFGGLTSLPGNAVLNMAMINQALVTVNALFMAETSRPEFREDRRWRLGEVIKLALTIKSLGDGSTSAHTP